MSEPKSKWIKFELVGQKPKTSVWNVKSTEDGFILGVVQWFARWRGYAFMPYGETVFEKVCLRDIADFVERKNAEHKVKTYG
jgi:hypothetical protein